MQLKERAVERGYEERQSTRKSTKKHQKGKRPPARGGCLADLAQGVLGIKLLFFELMELELLGRSEAHATVEGCNALRERGVLLF